VRLADIILDGAGIERRRIDVEPFAGSDDVADDEADGERQGREGQEIGHGLEPDPAERLQITHAGNAGDDGEEDDRGDDHLDQLDEAVAERLQRPSGLGRQPTDQHPQGDCHQHPEIKRPPVRPPRLLHRPLRLLPR
jgi:hypothetical protein